MSLIPLVTQYGATGNTTETVSEVLGQLRQNR
jgi:hypothetical protein